MVVLVVPWMMVWVRCNRVAMELEDWRAHSRRRGPAVAPPSGTSHETLRAKVAARQRALVLIDLGRPDPDGLEVIHRLREWSALPIIVLSARGQEHDKGGAPDAGADDRMSRPFGVGELLARISVALRHWTSPPGPDDTTITIGDLSVDLVRHSVSVAGLEVHLTPIESKLLRTFVRSPGKVLTQTQLVKEVWGSSGAQQTGALRVHIV